MYREQIKQLGYRISRVTLDFTHHQRWWPIQVDEQVLQQVDFSVIAALSVQKISRWNLLHECTYNYAKEYLDKQQDHG